MSCDRNTPFQRPWEPAFCVTCGASSEGRWRVFPPRVGVELPPCPPGDEWCLLGSEIIRLSWLRMPLLLALPPEFCQALMWDRELAGTWHVKRKFCSQGPEHCCAGRARPIWWFFSSIMHSGESGHMCLPLSLGKPYSRERMRRPPGQSKVVGIRKEEKGA